MSKVPRHRGGKYINTDFHTDVGNFPVVHSASESACRYSGSSAPRFCGSSIVAVLKVVSTWKAFPSRQGSVLDLLHGSMTTAFRFLFWHPLGSWYALIDVASVAVDRGLRPEQWLEPSLSVQSSSMNGMSDETVEIETQLFLMKT